MILKSMKEAAKKDDRTFSTLAVVIFKKYLMDTQEKIKNK